MKRIEAFTWISILMFFFVMTPVVFLLAVKSDTFSGTLLDSQWHIKRNPQPVTLLFTGDIMLGRYIETLMGRNGGEFPFTYMPEIIDEIEIKLGVDDLDLVVGNLEGPITSYGRNSNTSLIFNFKPSVVDLLKRTGFTTFSLANNHTLNQGAQGYTDTYNYINDGGLKAFGHPDTINGANSFLRYDYQDVSIGFFGLNDVDYKVDMDAVNARIRELDKQVDFLIIGIHWGIEYRPEAPSYIVDMSHQFVDNGADFIWGHHPHVIQNQELYNGAPIYYSLGNFVFDQYWSSKTQEGLVVGLKIDQGEITTTEVYVDLINLGEPKLRTN